MTYIRHKWKRGPYVFSRYVGVVLPYMVCGLFLLLYTDVCNNIRCVLFYFVFCVIFCESYGTLSAHVILAVWHALLPLIVVEEHRH